MFRAWKLQPISRSEVDYKNQATDSVDRKPARKRMIKNDSRSLFADKQTPLLMTNLPMKTRSWQSLLRVPRFPAPKKKVAIVVPISSRPELTQGELISLRHLYRFLSGYDIFFIKPPNTAPGLPDDATVIEFPQKYFGSNVAHSLMQMSPVFYEQFIDYEYILMYHLDALVFSDQLEDWCDKGFDYIAMV